jgi:SH3-like domain-containing protein
MRTLILSLALAVSLGGVAQTVSQRVTDAISQTKTKYAPDKRQIIYDVKAVYAKDSSVTITGKTSEASVKQQLFDALKAQGVKAKDELKVLPSDEWAQPRISVACLRVNPGHEAEMATQAIMGMPIRVLEKDGSWWHVQTPDGYIAWVIDNSLAPKTDAEMKAWREAKRLVVKSVYQTRAYTSAEANGVRDVVTDLVSGNIVEGSFDNVVNGRVQITLPDARVCWVDTVDVTPIEQWAAQDFDADVILNQAYSMEGTPYLWGGTSIKTLDCSGLAKVSYLVNGIILMRDASQQALTGTRIEAKDWRSCQPGDLLFFGNAKTRRVTHVAIYDSNGNYVHSSGRVKRNSIDPESPDYLTTPFLHAVRINGNIGTTGITYARNHSWYF